MDEDLLTVAGTPTFYEDPSIQIYHGDCRNVLAAMPDESVHCVVTSPPYWGLRDYGLEGSVWGAAFLWRQYAIQLCV